MHSSSVQEAAQDTDGLAAVVLGCGLGLDVESSGQSVHPRSSSHGSSSRHLSLNFYPRDMHALAIFGPMACFRWPAWLEKLADLAVLLRLPLLGWTLPCLPSRPQDWECMELNTQIPADTYASLCPAQDARKRHADAARLEG